MRRLSANVIRASGGSKAAALVLDQTVGVRLPVCASPSLQAMINTSRMKEEECEKIHPGGGGALRQFTLTQKAALLGLQ